MSQQERNIEEYLRILTGQIRCRMARPAVEEEVRAHIEDQTRALMSGGMDRAEAERMAVCEMGDPVETGNELDKIHRPQMPWGMIILTAILSLVGYVIQVLVSQKITSAGGEGVFNYGGQERQLIFMIVGFAVMTGICFVDYTRIAERARELLAALFLVLILGLTFFGLMVNGAERWIDVGVSTIDAVMVLMLTVPLYAAVLYRYRGCGKSAVAKALLWMLPGGWFALRCCASWMSGILLLSYLVIFCTAVYKGWFLVSRKLTLGITAAAVVIIPGTIAAAVWGLGASYQKERLLAMMGKMEGAPYAVEFIREWLGGSRLIGETAQLQSAAYLKNSAESMLAGIAGYYGILAAVAVAAVLLLLLLRFLHISLKQRNQLGMLMGTGCAAVLLIQAGIYILNNMGITYIGTYCLFFMGSGTGTIVSYVILGILFSICRYQNTAPERRRSGTQKQRLKKAVR